MSAVSLLLIVMFLVPFLGWLFWGRDSKEYKEHELRRTDNNKLRKKKLDKINGKSR